jgi:uncharacterized membrane protein YphA (DoxX/SURF4 family)
MNRLDDLLARTGSLRRIAPLRIAAGPLVVWHLEPFLRAGLDGRVVGDTFSVPFAAWYPVVPREVYLFLLWLAVPVAALLSIGLFTRAASVYTAAFVAYNLFLSQTHFHHNRAFLLILLIGLAVLRSGDHLSVDAAVRRRHGWEPSPAPLWPLWLLRMEVAAVYLASGFSKLIDPDWFGGTVLRLRIEQWDAVARSRGAPGWALDLLSDPGVMAVFAKVVVLTELFIGIGLLWRRTRPVAVVVAVAFHVAIQFTASVQVFSLAAIAALVIWADPIDEPLTRLLTRQRRTRGPENDRSSSSRAIAGMR